MRAPVDCKAGQTKREGSKILNTLYPDGGPMGLNLIALIILWFSKLVASDQHGLVMLSLGYLIYVPSMCQL